MKVQPIAAPSAPQTSANDARAKAIAAFNQGAPQPEPKVVQDQTNVSAEEMTAIQPNMGQPDDIEQEIQEVTEEPVKPEPTPEEVAISRQFAQLARQEKALRAKAQQQEQSIKAREAAIQAREAELASKSTEDRSGYLSREALKADPLSALAEAGISYEELTQQIINQQPVDPRLQQTITQLKQEIQQLKMSTEESKKSYADNQAQAYQAAVKQITADVNNLVSSNPEFETIKFTGSTKDVVDLIERTYHQDGILLSVEEAAQQVEDYLVEESLKLAKIEKIRQKLHSVAPKAPSSQAQQPAPKSPQQQPMKTLTNATSSSRQLSARERALLAFKGELKS